MAKKKKPDFPETVVISRTGSGYLTLHQQGVEQIGQDTIVGVYELKHVSLVRVKRKLERLE